MIPDNILSAAPISAAFLPPRTGTRFSPLYGQYDTHYGGVAIGDPSLGIQYQLWSAIINGEDIDLAASNTPQFTLLEGVNAAWVALAFDQNARVFLAWCTSAGALSYYYFDTLANQYKISSVPTNPIYRCFAALDDARPELSSSADILLAYVKPDGNLAIRAQRDRYGIEYVLGAAPAVLVQIGMNRGNRFQFAFQNVQGGAVLPPAEFTGASFNG